MKSKDQQKAKVIAKIDYEPCEICQKCILTHVFDKGLKFDIQCKPISAQEYDKLINESNELVKIARFAPQFVEYVLNLQPRGFQYEQLVCNSKRKVLRLPRKAGKTWLMAMHILYEAFTNEHCRILVAGPRQNHIAEIFDRLNDFVSSSEILQESVVRQSNTFGKFYKSNPFELRFKNGSIVKGFTAGQDADAVSIRGQSADFIVLDELDYMLPSQVDSIIAILNTNKNSKLIQQSTPSGRRDHFYKWCNQPHFKEFHLKYQELEIYDERQDKEYQNSMSQDRYQREVLAEFISQESGVYRNELIDQQLDEYNFDGLNAIQGCRYQIGVDWNESNAGVYVVVARLEYTPDADYKVRISNIIHIPPHEFTQVKAVEQIAKQCNQYKPDYLIPDEGFGNMQIQVLKQMQDAGQIPIMQDRIVPVNFGQNILVFDQITKHRQETKQKPFLVSNSVRMLENGKLILPASEDTPDKLVGIMRSYQFIGVTENGIPKYTKGNTHVLEQMLLQLYGIYLTLNSQPLATIPTFSAPTGVYISRPVGYEPTKNRYFERRGVRSWKRF